MLHHGSVGQGLSKKCYFVFECPLLNFVCYFLAKKLCFYHFHLFFFEILSNFRNRIITNRKLELVIRNCQWNCM